MRSCGPRVPEKTAHVLYEIMKGRKKEIGQGGRIGGCGQSCSRETGVRSWAHCELTGLRDSWTSSQGTVKFMRQVKQCSLENSPLVFFWSGQLQDSIRTATSHVLAYLLFVSRQVGVKTEFSAVLRRIELQLICKMTLMCSVVQGLSQTRVLLKKSWPSRWCIKFQ